MDYQKSLLNKLMNKYKDEDKCKQNSLNQIGNVRNTVQKPNLNFNIEDKSKNIFIIY